MPPPAKTPRAPQPEDRLPPVAQLLRIDTCAAVSSGLIHTDPLSGIYLQKLSLWFSLRAGEPRRVFRSLAKEIMYRAMMGGHVPTRAEENVQRLAFRLREGFPELGAIYDGSPGMDARCG